MKKTAKILFGLLLLLNLAACCNITYEGKECQPLPETENVEVFYSKKQIPTQKYVVLGKAVAKAASNYTVAEIEQKLKVFARTKGANGILVISIDQISVGEARPDQIENKSDTGWSVNDSSGNAFNHFKDEMEKKAVKSPTIEGEIFKYRMNTFLIQVPRTK